MTGRVGLGLAAAAVVLVVGGGGVAGRALAQAPTYAVGTVVACYGTQGPIIRIEPRPGWDEPFYVIRTPDGDSKNEMRCLPKEMRRASAPAPTARFARGAA